MRYLVDIAGEIWRRNLEGKKHNKMKSEEREKLLREHVGERSRCMVFTRVMGYHRPIESFNIGKTGEHGERRLFEEGYLKIGE